MFIQIIVNVQNDRKTTKMVNFEHILDIFLVLCNWFVLIPDSFCILSDISWDRFRVPTTHTFVKKYNQLGDFWKYGISGHFRRLWVQVIKRNPENWYGSYFNHLNANFAIKIEFWDDVKKDIYKRLKTLKIPSAPKKSPKCLDFMKIS